MNFWIALSEIMFINIILSGDNAVVIALAARSLPAKQRNFAVLLGCGGAIVLRILLTCVAVLLLQIPFLQLLGAFLLIWIAVKLLVDANEEKEDYGAGKGLFDAVKTILIADVVMSLDNTLAIAGIAKGDWTLLISGLVLSIPLIVFGSSIVMKLMDRFPVIVYIGAGLIAWTAGGMINGDKALALYLSDLSRGSSWLLPVALTIAVVSYGYCNNRKRSNDLHKEVLVNK